MTRLYLAWVKALEENLKAATTVADHANDHGLRSGLAMNEILLRIWFPWTF